MPQSDYSHGEGSGYLMPVQQAESPPDCHAGSSQEITKYANANPAFDVKSEKNLAPCHGQLTGTVSLIIPKISITGPDDRTGSCTAHSTGLEPKATFRKHRLPGSSKSVGCRDMRPHSAPTPGAVRCARGSSCWRHAHAELYYCCCCCCSGGAGRKVTVLAAAKARRTSQLTANGSCRAGWREVPQMRCIQEQCRGDRDLRLAKASRRDLPAVPLYLDVSMSDGLGGVYDSLHHSPNEGAGDLCRKRKNPLYWDRPQESNAVVDIDTARKLLGYVERESRSASATLNSERVLKQQTKRILLWSLLVPSLVLVSCMVLTVLIATKTLGKRDDVGDGSAGAAYAFGGLSVSTVRQLEERVVLLQMHIDDVTKGLEANSTIQLALSKLRLLESVVCYLMDQTALTNHEPVGASTDGHPALAELRSYCSQMAEYRRAG